MDTDKWKSVLVPREIYEQYIIAYYLIFRITFVSYACEQKFKDPRLSPCGRGFFFLLTLIL